MLVLPQADCHGPRCQFVGHPSPETLGGLGPQDPGAGRTLSLSLGCQPWRLYPLSHLAGSAMLFGVSGNCHGGIWVSGSNQPCDWGSFGLVTFPAFNLS